MTGLKVDAKPTQASPEMSDGKYFTCPLGQMTVDYVWREEALRKKDHRSFDHILNEPIFLCVLCNGPNTFQHNLLICFTTKPCL